MKTGAELLLLIQAAQATIKELQERVEYTPETERTRVEKLRLQKQKLQVLLKQQEELYRSGTPAPWVALPKQVNS